MRFVRLLAAEAYESPVGTDVQVDRVLAEYRRSSLEAYLTTEQLDVLGAVLERPTELPSGDITAELLATWRLLPTATASHGTDPTRS